MRVKSDICDVILSPDRMASIGVGDLPFPAPRVRGKARKGEMLIHADTAAISRWDGDYLEVVTLNDRLVSF